MKHTENPKPAAALAALIEGATIANAAQRADVSERTVARWLRDPQFSLSLNESGRTATRQAITRVQQALDQSVTGVLGLLQQAETPPQARIRAMQVLFNIAGQSSLNDLELRLQQLESSTEAEAAELQRSYDTDDEELFHAS